jgi:hypothetical protein
MTQRKRNRNAWTKWRRLISEQMRSEKSVAAFCREQKLRASHFYWWKKRLRENTAARLVEVQVAESPANVAGASRIEVRLQNGRSLMVGRGFDPEHVRGLLAVVEAVG